MNARLRFRRAVTAGAVAFALSLLLTGAIAGGVLQFRPSLGGYTFPGTLVYPSNTIEVEVYGTHDFFWYNSGLNGMIVPTGAAHPMNRKPEGSAYVEFRFRQFGWPRAVRYSWEFAALDNIQLTPGAMASTAESEWRAVVAEHRVKAHYEGYDFVFSEHDDLLAGEQSGKGGSWWNVIPNGALRLVNAPVWLGGCILISICIGVIAYRGILARGVEWSKVRTPPGSSPTSAVLDGMEDEPEDSLARPLVAGVAAFQLAAIVLLSAAGTSIALTRSQEAFALTGAGRPPWLLWTFDRRDNYDFYRLDDGHVLCSPSNDLRYQTSIVPAANADVVYYEVEHGYPAPLAINWGFSISNWRAADPAAPLITEDECRTAFVEMHSRLREDSRFLLGIEGGATSGRVSRWSNLPYNVFWCLVHSPIWVGVCVAAAAIIGLKVFFDSRRRWRERLGLCVGCAYNLRATVAGQPCPECGRESLGVAAPPRYNTQDEQGICKVQG